MSGKRGLSARTLDILQMLTDGHTVRSVSEFYGMKMHAIYSIKSRYPDIIAEMQGKRMDGTPLAFEPGLGVEIDAQKQPEVAQHEPVQEEPRRHSIRELFDKIQRLEEANAVLLKEKKYVEEQMHEAIEREESASERAEIAEKKLAEVSGKANFDGREMLKFLLNEIIMSADGISDLQFLRGVAHSISYIMDGYTYVKEA